MNNNELKDLYVDFKTLTYFLLSLFYKTDCKYSCSRTKVGKLLSILAFEYAINGKKLFEEDIYKYDECGTYISRINWYVDRDEYMKACYQDDKKYINDQFDDSFEMDPKIEEHEHNFKFLPNDVKLSTIAVFRRFGAYSQTDLGELLNPIAEQVTSVSYGKIELSKISSVIDKIEQENEIISYLKSNEKEIKKIKIKKLY